MANNRELILTRLLEILTALGAANGVNAVFRNRDQLTFDLRPAFLLLDGDETIKPGNAGQRPQLAPQIMHIDPEIYCILENRRPNNANVGPDLNAMYAKIIKAILTDAALKTIIGPTQRVRYTAAVTDMARGRALNGEIGIGFQIEYIFDPNTL